MKPNRWKPMALAYRIRVNHKKVLKDLNALVELGIVFKEGEFYWRNSTKVKVDPELSAVWKGLVHTAPQYNQPFNVKGCRSAVDGGNSIWYSTKKKPKSIKHK